MLYSTRTNSLLLSILKVQAVALICLQICLYSPLSSFPSDEPTIDNDHARDSIIPIPNNDASASISASDHTGSDEDVASSSAMGDTFNSDSSSSPSEEVTTPVVTHVHQMRTRLQNNVTTPKQFIDGMVRYPLIGRTAFSAKPSSLKLLLIQGGKQQCTMNFRLSNEIRLGIWYQLVMERMLLGVNGYSKSSTNLMDLWTGTKLV